MVRSSVVVLMSLLVFLHVGCAGEGDRQTIKYRGLATFEASPAWTPLESGVEHVGFEHEDYPGVELWITGETEEIGGALSSEHVRALLGREVNLKYGGAVSRLSMEGNAVIRFETEAEGHGGTDQVRWIVARPWSSGHILRLDVSIEYEPGILSAEELEEIVDDFDPGVADTTFPAAVGA